MQFSNLGTAFGVQSAGKSIEIYDVKNAEEIEKKRKRRLKRRREKENSKKIKLEEQNRREKDSDDDKSDEDEDEKDENKVNANAFELSSIVRPTGKSIAPFAFQPETMDSHLSKSVSLAICLDSNAIEVYDIADVSAKKDANVKEAKNDPWRDRLGTVRMFASSRYPQMKFPSLRFAFGREGLGRGYWKMRANDRIWIRNVRILCPGRSKCRRWNKRRWFRIIDCLAGTNSMPRR